MLVLQSYHENGKAPRRLEVGRGEPSFAQSPKDLHCRHYFKALDLALEAIQGSEWQKDLQKSPRCVIKGSTWLTI